MATPPTPPDVPTGGPETPDAWNNLLAIKTAVYNQNFAQFRSLSDQLHRLPTFSTTLIGGLWFAAGLKDTLATEIRFALIYLAGWFGLLAIFVMFRLRDVMQSYQEKIEEFYPDGYASGMPQKPMLSAPFNSYSMVLIFAIMAGITVLLSWAAAFIIFWPKNWICAWYGVGATLAAVLSLLCLIVLLKPKTSRETMGGVADGGDV